MRREGDTAAERSWHVVVTAMTLAEHSNEPVDLFRVMQLLAVHDLAEVTLGDLFYYDKCPSSASEEAACVRSLFGALPGDQAEDYFALWAEFEAGKTPEARFAVAIDRLWLCLQDYSNQGGSWLQSRLSLERAVEKNRQIAYGSLRIWDYVEALLRDADRRGFLYKEKSP